MPKNHPKVKKGDWPRMFNRLGFPKSAKNYASFSKIKDATQPTSSLFALLRWESDLIARFGYDGFLAERARLLERGKLIDDSIQEYIESGEQLDALKALETAPAKVVKYVTDKYETTDFLVYELPIWSHRYKYRGYLDAAIVDSGEFILTDWKGANRRKGEQELRDYAQQLAAYLYALREMYESRDPQARLLFSFFPKLKKALGRAIRRESLERARLVFFIDDEARALEVDFSKGNEIASRDLAQHFKSFLSRVDYYWRIKPDNKGKRHNPKTAEAKKMLLDYERNRKESIFVNMKDVKNINLK